jgi:peptide/nickel transport system permease protein
MRRRGGARKARILRIGRFLGLRLVALGSVLILVTGAVFGALYLAPGSPVSVLAGGRPLSPAAVEALKRQYHLNLPVWRQYLDWVGGLLHGDFGRSVIFGEPVSQLMGNSAMNSLTLVGFASCLILTIGISAGVVSALWERRVAPFILLTTTVGLAIPSFVTGMFLISIFAVSLRWFPVFGSGVGVVGTLRHLVLPGVALAIPPMAYVTQLTRTTVSGELHREHVETALGRGLPYWSVVRRHVLRNALIPIVTAGGLVVASLIAGDVVVENVFAIHGLGFLLVQSVQEKDYPTVQGVAVVLVVAFVAVNALVDVVTPLIDPRLRRGAK